MDDYNTSMLSEAKNEYCVRLLNILTPLVIEGIKSILKEADQLCMQNDEESKYLMTFQNFLSRVPKWNNDIISEETDRIIKKSGCNYLEDLLTCVHITQLKVLTSIRVGSLQKKIELDIPKLNGNKIKDWNSKSGRWQAIALTVQSHKVKNRLLSTGYDRFKKDPLRFKEMYRNTLVE